MEIIIAIIFMVGLGILLFIMLNPATEEEEIIQDRLYRISKASQQAETENTEEKKSIVEFILTVYLEPLVTAMNKKGENAKGKKDIRQLLMEAGQPYSDDDVLRFKATQFFAAIFGLVFGLIVSLILAKTSILLVPVVLILSIMVAFVAPKFILRSKINKRNMEITYNLPDALDLLVVCVEAGLGLDAALSRVSNEQARTSPTLAREMGRVSKDILAGIPRQEAFRNLAARNNVPDLKSFVALLIQTDKLGTSISQSLRVYSETVRTKRRQRAEKLAAEASVKMVIPLVLFILPSMFVVLLGPAIINLIQEFTGVK